MLQAIREHAQGWIAWAIVILISIPFALWGIQEYLGGGSQPLAAKVNGHKITQRELDRRFQQFRIELRQRLGKAYRPEMFDDTKLREEVLNDLIRNSVILQASTDMGLRAGDAQVQAEILAIPAFQKNGHFDKEAYERAVAYQGMSTAQFEENVRGSLMTSQLSQVVAGSEFVTPAELRDAVRLGGQQRKFAYITVPAKGLGPKGPIPDDQVKAYYQSHQKEFRTPERVKLDYLVLDRGTGGGSGQADEAALRALYKKRLASFTTPEERRARHILITLPPDADAKAEKAAREKILAIKKRLDAGEDFAKVAAETSEDPGTAKKGGDLGFFKRGVMTPAFEKAAFALKKGEISGPVRSAFGYHLIQVTDIHPAKVKPFDEVRAQLAASLQSGDADQKYFKLADKLGNITYEHPDSLAPAADALNLKVQHSGWLTRDGGEGLLGDPKVMRAAFSDDVLQQRNNSEVIEVDTPKGQKAIVLRIADHQEASTRSLDEVKTQIVDILRKQAAEEAATKIADALAARLRKGEDQEKVAAGYSLKQLDWVGRNAADVPLAVADEAFTLPAPAKGAASVGVASLGKDGAAVVRLTQVRDGSLKDMDAAKKASERKSLARSLARASYDSLVNDLRSRASVEIVTKDTNTSGGAGD